MLNEPSYEATQLGAAKFVGLVCFREGVDESCPKPCRCSFERSETSLTVNCSWQKLTSIPGPLPVNTDHLDLWKNQLNKLPGGVFNHNTKLETLDLSENQLTDLPDGIFDKNVQLSDLDLWKNQLNKLPGGVFNHNTKLETLDLSENQLTDLPDGIFDKNVQLSDL
ncbi:leucine-rich repeat and transmembrane domain-containing protein 2-like [Montipora foliosa]|uniref:leucine-rich repeat and transmembrane domain-containing protein 2-like n=1 Tax=Montipora foliosa TaxID=591990 RepID=UPI0035F1175F